MKTLIQISDLHLFEDAAAVLKDVRTDETFERVLSVIEREFAAAAAIVITGDLAHDERFETYDRLKRRLGTLVPKVRLVPGNHDHRASMIELFGEQILPNRKTVGFHAHVSGWQLIGLDSHLPGETTGEVSGEQIVWLGDTLKSSADTPTLVFLHHPPLGVHSPWLDAIGLKNADIVCDLIESSPQVKGVFFGHIHQEFESRIGSTRCYAVPSTGVQFKPRTESLIVDDRPPGFRVIELLDDTFETRVVRVSGD